MAVKQIICWFFVALGVAIILYSLYNSFQIFNGLKNAPSIFVTQESIKNPAESSILPEEIAIQFQQYLKNVMPSSNINQLLNLISWSIFSWILIIGGSHIASLGIKLLSK